MSFATFDPAAKSTHITLSGGDLIATGDGNTGYCNVAGTLYVSSGKYYFEFTPTNNNGSTRVIGVAKSTDSIADGNAAPYTGANGYGYVNDGNKSHNSALVAYGATWTNADVIGVALDLTNGAIYFRKNGTWQNGGDPTSGGSMTGAAYTGLSGSYRAVWAAAGNGGQDGTINFGASAFAASAPTGYTGWTNDITISAPTADTILKAEAPTFTAPVIIAAPTADTVLNAEAPTYSYGQIVFPPSADIIVNAEAPTYALAFLPPTAGIVVNAEAPGYGRSISVGTAETRLTAGRAHFAQTHVHSSGIGLKYTIYQRVFSAIVAPYTFKVTKGYDLGYSLRHVVQQDNELPYKIRNVDKLQKAVEINFNIRLQAAVNLRWQLTPTYPVSKAVELPYSVRPMVKVGKALPYHMTLKVHAATELKYKVLSFNRVNKTVVGIWSLAGKSVILTTDEPHLILNGQRVDVVEGDISTNEGGYAWECNFTLAKVTDYVQFVRGGIFTANLYGETWTFEVDGKELSRPGPAKVSNRIMGVSPSAQYTSPRSSQADYLWDAPVSARDAAEEVTGVTLDWDIVDWTIPAYRLAFSHSEPLAVVRKLAEVAGGVVESTLDGELHIRNKYPVSPQDYATATPDHTYVELDHIISVSETYGYNDVFNKFRILDVNENIRDSMQWIEDYPDSLTGVMRVNPSPWRQTVDLVHTGDGTVVIGTPSVVYRTMEEEILEVFKGAGTTSEPIYDIISVVWEATNLGSIVFAQDSSDFTVSGPAANSVIRLVYRTRSLDYPITSGSGRPTQFLLESANP